MALVLPIVEAALMCPLVLHQFRFGAQTGRVGLLFLTVQRVLLVH